MRLQAWEPVRIDITAAVANVFPYATLDATVDEKFTALGIGG
jgi:hypothetical protein